MWFDCRSTSDITAWSSRTNCGVGGETFGASGGRLKLCLTRCLSDQMVNALPNEHPHLALIQFVHDPMQRAHKMINASCQFLDQARKRICCVVTPERSPQMSVHHSTLWGKSAFDRNCPQRRIHSHLRLAGDKCKARVWFHASPTISHLQCLALEPKHATALAYSFHSFTAMLSALLLQFL